MLKRISILSITLLLATITRQVFSLPETSSNSYFFRYTTKKWEDGRVDKTGESSTQEATKEVLLADIASRIITGTNYWEIGGKQFANLINQRIFGSPDVIGGEDRTEHEAGESDTQGKVGSEAVKEEVSPLLIPNGMITGLNNWVMGGKQLANLINQKIVGLPDVIGGEDKTEHEAGESSTQGKVGSEAVKGEVGQTNDSIAHGDDEILQVKSRIMQAKGEIALARSEIARAKTEIAQAKNKITQANCEIRQAYDEIGVGQLNGQFVYGDDQIAQIKGKIAQANDQIAQADGRIEQANGQIGQAKSQIEQAKNQIAQAENQIAHVESTLKRMNQ